MIHRLTARLRRSAERAAEMKKWLPFLSKAEWRALTQEARDLQTSHGPPDLVADESYAEYLTIQMAAERAATAAERTDAAQRRQKLVDRMLNYVPMSDRRAANVLAVGCRDGLELDALAEITGGHVHGLDLPRPESEIPDPRIQVGDLHRLPFADQSIDIAFACHALEHAFDFDRAVDELFRVLRPGGWLILEVEVSFLPDSLRRYDGGTRDELSAYFQRRVDDPSRDQVLAVDMELPQKIGEREVRSLRIFVHLEAPAGAGNLGVDPPHAGDEMHVLPPTGSLVIRMDITNKCNLECIHCSLDWTREELGEPKANMPVGDFAKIAEQIFPRASVVALSCEAEPMMHRDFLDILEIVKKSPGPGYVMTTNGTLINEKRLDALFECGLSHLNISFDGATKETFERIRKKGRFERAVQGVEKFRDRKRALGFGRHDFPTLQVNYTLMRSTLEELPQMVEICREWDVHQLTLQHLYALPVNKLYDESPSHNKKRSDELLQEASALCEKYGIQTVFPQLFEPPEKLVQIGAGPTSKIPEPEHSTTPYAAPKVVNPAGENVATADAEEPGASDSGDAQHPGSAEAPGRSFYCLAPWRMMKIRWNGDVLPCDVWRDEPLGNLGQQSFEEIWNSHRYKTLRDGLALGQPSHSSCIHCDTVTTDNLEGKEVSSPFANTPRSTLRPVP